jgi:ribosome-associated protein
MAKRVAKKSTKTTAKPKAKADKPAKKGQASLVKKAAKAVARVAKKIAGKATTAKTVKKATKKVAAKPQAKKATKPAAKPVKKVAKKVAAKTAPKKKIKPSLTSGVPTDVAEIEAQSRGGTDSNGPIVLDTEIIEMDESADDIQAMPANADRATGRGVSPAEAAILDADIIAKATTPRDGTVRPHDMDRARAFAIAAARMCKDDKCDDVLVLDVSKIRQDVDFIVLASGTSDRQMRSVLQHLEEHGNKMNTPAVRTSKDDRATWLLADFVDVVVHLFEPNTRAHYNLEMHFADAPKVAWEREDQQNRDRAGLMDVRNN